MRKMKQVTMKGYEGYSKAYDKKAETITRHGGMMKLEKLTPAEWFDTYSAYRNDLVAEVEQGARKQIGNVNQYIISDQAYFMSAKQARNIQKGLEKTYEEYEDSPEFERVVKETTIRNLRTGKFDWKTIKGSLGWQSFLSDEYQKAKKTLGSAKKASQYIQDFFFGGSPT